MVKWDIRKLGIEEWLVKVVMTMYIGDAKQVGMGGFLKLYLMIFG